MPLKAQPFDIGKINRGIDNVSPSIQITNGRCVTGSNIEYLRSGGWSVRLGSAKKTVTPFTSDIVGVTQLTRRDGTNKYVIFLADGKIFDYDGNVTFVDTTVTQNAPGFHRATNFYKENTDYIIFSGGNDYIKKLSWIGDWDQVGGSVTGTPADDLVTGLRVISSTEIYANVSSGASAGIYKWNGSAWASFCPLIETFTINNYFALEGTDYVYAATSGGVYVFSSSWNFWMRLGTDTDAYFDVLATATNSVYAVKDTKIRKYTTSWADVQTIGSATDYGIYYLNSTFIVLEKNTSICWESSNGTSWSDVTIPDPTPFGPPPETFPYGYVKCFSDGTNYIFLCRSDKNIYLTYTSDFSTFNSINTGGSVASSTALYKLEAGYSNSNYIVAVNFTYNVVFPIPATVTAIDCFTTISLSTAFSADFFHTINGIELSKIYFFTSETYLTDAAVTSSYYNYFTAPGWSIRTCALNKIDHIQSMNGQIGAIGLDTTIKQSYSSDGITWPGVFTHYVYASNTEQYGCNADGVFKFDGSSWAELGTLTDAVKIARLSPTSIYACTDNGLYNWNGTAWTKGPVIGIDDIRDIAVVSSSEIYVASWEAGIYKYDGASWSKYGSTIADNKLTSLGYISNNLYSAVESEGVYGFTIGYVIENVGDRAEGDTEAFVFDGNVTTAGITIDTIDAGDVTKLKVGSYLSHPSLPVYLYVTKKVDATSIEVSEPIPSGAYTGIEVIFAPRAKYVEVYNDILFAGNVTYEGTEQTSEIHYSRDDTPDLDEWFGIATGIRRILSVGFNDNDEITGLRTVGRVLGIWKNNTIHALSGTSENNFILTKISDVGCIAPNSLQICVFNNGSTGALFMGRSGFYTFDGSNVAQTESMKNYEYDLDMTKLDQMTSVFDKQSNKYKVSFYVNGGGRKTVVYQSQLDAFSEETNYSDAYGLFEDVEYRGISKAFFRDNSGLLDDTTPITFTFKTALYSLNTPGILKVIREFMTEYKSKNADYTMNVYVENNATPVYTISVDNASTERIGTDRRSFGVNTQYVQFEVTGTADLFEFYRLIFKYRMIGER